MKRSRRRTERTPDQQRELVAIRERFGRERPNLADLRASGDIDTVVAQGEYIELLAMLQALKGHRERQGLSLADVTERSGIDRSAISRLEGGANVNPTIDTLYRYARAVGAELGFTVRAS